MAGEPGFFDDPNGAAGPEGDAPSDLFGAVAKAGERAGVIGRPPGARNRKTEAFERWFFARYKDPATFLGELVTMDARALRQLMREEHAADQVPGLVEILKLQMAAAGELMPYLHGKVPQAVVVAVEQLPMLVINAGLNQVDQVRELEQKALSIGAPLADSEGSKIKDLEGGE